jgi:hypothetical protein
MSRANALAFIQALAIVMCALYLPSWVEQRDEITAASEAHAIRAERLAQADSVLGIKRVKLAAK